jgi:hypothetical protein
MVCGSPVCGPCSYIFGNEGTVRCRKHSMSNNDNNSDDDETVIENQATANVAKSKNQNQSSIAADSDSEGEDAEMEVNVKVPKKKTTVIKKSDAYTAKELLLLSQAFIRASEDVEKGVSRKSEKLWEHVTEVYHMLKSNQEAYDRRQDKKKRYHSTSIRLFDDDSFNDDDEIYMLPVRTPNSLQLKWSKGIKPEVTRFISLTKRFPKKSGEDDERYYQRIHMIYVENFPDQKSFDIYRPSWEYLKDCAKWHTISVTHAKSNAIKRKKDDAASDAEEELTNSRSTRPMGKKKAQRMQEENKIVEQVAASLGDVIGARRSNVHASNSNILASAIDNIVDVIKLGMQNWTDQQAYKNADPELRKQYDNLCLRKRIEEMEKQNAKHDSTVTPMN